METVKIISATFNGIGEMEELTGINLEVKIDNDVYRMEFSKDYITRYRIFEVKGKSLITLEDKCSTYQFGFYNVYLNNFDDYEKFLLNRIKTLHNECKKDSIHASGWCNIANRFHEPVLSDWTILDVVKYIMHVI